MCNGTRKPISQVTPSNGANTTHARTPSLEETKGIVTLKTQAFIRILNLFPSSYTEERLKTHSIN